MSKVRGRSREDPMPEGWWPRGATQSLRSGAAAKRSCPTSEIRGGSQECQAVTAQEWPRGAAPPPRSGAAAKRSYPLPEARGGGRVEQPHIQGTVAVWAQEGLGELFHVQGQEGQR